jgi:hypothetical protein
MCTQKRRLEDGHEGGQGPTRTVEPRSQSVIHCTFKDPINDRY